jgi:ribokinase
MGNDIDVAVLGSFNVDFILSTERIPYPGETISSSKLEIYPGGKGNNQAVALGKLGADTVMLGCVGNDENGDMLVKNLIRNGVTADYVEKVNERTGIAFINIFDGKNTIILFRGANGLVEIRNMEKHTEVIKKSKLLLTQNEVPYETIKWAIKTAHENGVKTVFNPAPAFLIEDDLWKYLDVIVTNEIECKTVLGIDENENIPYEKLIEMLQNKGVKSVVITLGADGAIYSDKGIIKAQPAIKTNVADTTGAGDAFIGGLTYSLSKGEDINRAVKTGIKLAAVKIGFVGAQNYTVSKDFFKNI